MGNKMGNISFRAPEIGLGNIVPLGDLWFPRHPRPEPSALAVIGLLGAGVLAWMRRKGEVVKVVVMELKSIYLHRHSCWQLFIAASRGIFDQQSAISPASGCRRCWPSSRVSKPRQSFNQRSRNWVLFSLSSST